MSFKHFILPSKVVGRNGEFVKQHVHHISTGKTQNIISTRLSRINQIETLEGRQHDVFGIVLHLQQLENCGHHAGIRYHRNRRPPPTILQRMFGELCERTVAGSFVRMTVDQSVESVNQLPAISGTCQKLTEMDLPFI